jgi:hypothetical protein
MTTLAVPQTTLFPLDIPVPRKDTSLPSKAMLCSLSIGTWPGYKYDPEASEEIAEIHQAEKDAGRFNKRLVPRREMKEITKVISQARRDHAFLTLPWFDDGYRALPAAAYMEHAETMTLHGAQFRAAVSRFENRFESLVTNQSRLGTLFNVEDYPGMRKEGEILRFAFPQELRDWFSFKTNVLPLHESDDFRVAIGDEERNRIQRQLEESIQASLRAGTRELWQRLYDVVSHMSARMTEYNAAEDGSKPKLYKSMVANIVEIVDVLPKLNIARDSGLDRLADEVRRSLLVDTKELRKSEVLRVDTAKAAADIAHRMAAYMGVQPAPHQAIS